MLRRALVAFAILAPSTLAAQEPDARMTTRELWDAFTKNRAGFTQQYLNKSLEVSGPLWAVHVRGDGSDSDLQLSINGVARAVECIVPDSARSELASLKDTKATITVRGTWGRNYGYVSLKPCTWTVGEVPGPGAAVRNAPKDVPMGRWTVRQMANLGTYGRQFELTLVRGGRYRTSNGPAGRFTYDAHAKLLHFTSGGLRGFTALYYVEGPNADGPTLALDQEGGIPDPKNAARGRYQYATFDSK